MDTIRSQPSIAIGSRVAFLRSAHGLTQRELGLRAGMKRPNVSRLECGRCMPTVDVLLSVAAALGVQPSAILCVLDEVAT